MAIKEDAGGMAFLLPQMNYVMIDVLLLGGKWQLQCKKERLNVEILGSFPIA